MRLRLYVLDRRRRQYSTLAPFSRSCEVLPILPSIRRGITAQTGHEGERTFVHVTVTESMRWTTLPLNGAKQRLLESPFSFFWRFQIM